MPKPKSQLKGGFVYQLRI